MFPRFCPILGILSLAPALACGACHKGDPDPTPAPPPRLELRVEPHPPKKGEPLQLIGREGIYCAVRHDEPDLACVGTDVLKLRPEVVEPYDENSQAYLRANVPVVVREFPVVEVTPSCAVWDDGTVRCWSNPEGTSAPTPVEGLKPSRGFGQGSQRCSLATDGEVQCWAKNVCAPSDSDRISTPFPIPGLPPAVDLSLGSGITCAIDRQHQVWCWGYLEARDLCSDDVARPIAGVADAVQLATGNSSACALSATGSIECWGENHWGALGRPEAEIAFSPEPLSLPGITTGVEIRGFHGAFVALEDDGDVWMWGWNMTADKNDVAPRLVPEASPAIDIVVGSSHGCALLADHNLRCFGKRIDRRPDKSVRPPFEDKAAWIDPRPYVFGKLSRQWPPTD